MCIKFYLRSAGFEPAIPSLGSSYLNQSGLTSLDSQLDFTINKFLSFLKHRSTADIPMNPILATQYLNWYS
jgi:hypothetical protein